MDNPEITDRSCDIYDAGDLESAMYRYTNQQSPLYPDYGAISVHTEVLAAALVPGVVLGQLALDNLTEIEVCGFETAYGSMMEKIRRPDLQPHPWYTRGVRFSLPNQANSSNGEVHSLTYYSVRHSKTPHVWPLVVKLALSDKTEKMIGEVSSNVRPLRSQWSPDGNAYEQLVNNGIQDRTTIAGALEVQAVTRFLREITPRER